MASIRGFSGNDLRRKIVAEALRKRAFLRVPASRDQINLVKAHKFQFFVACSRLREIRFTLEAPVFPRLASFLVPE